VRLIRGSSTFLAAVTEWTSEAANGPVFSPALYSSATRIWKKAGYGPMLRLKIMEKKLVPVAELSERVSEHDPADIGPLEQVDHAAFDEFWRMDTAGLSEAIAATPRARVLKIDTEIGMGGYAIVGSQLGISFLQRIAVSNRHQGMGFGSELLKASMRWALDSGAATMVLNVRSDNEVALGLYSRHGFVDTKTSLRLLRYDG
jgi:ribosomal protein S18 acetylase RimI-like enzyme